jgi:hypothetical protein
MKLTTIAVLTSLAVMTTACVPTQHTSSGLESAQESTVTLSELLTTAAPSGQLHAFAAPSHRMAGGFEQVTLEELAANPKAYFRNEQAYATFKRSFEIHLNKELDDTAFQKLLSSDRVKIHACEGAPIRTAGIDDMGRIGWINRSCEDGENLIYVRVGDEWAAVAAMGCLNPLDALVMRPKWIPLDPHRTQQPSPPPPPPPPPEPEKPDFVRPGLGPTTTYEDAYQAFLDQANLPEDQRHSSSGNHDPRVK